MSRSPRRFALTALLSLLFFAGCSQSVSVPIGKAATSYPLSENAADALIEVVLDGVVDEWHGVAPIWYEAGVVGQGPSRSGIDI